MAISNKNRQPGSNADAEAAGSPCDRDVAFAERLAALTDEEYKEYRARVAKARHRELVASPVDPSFSDYFGATVEVTEPAL